MKKIWKTFYLKDNIGVACFKKWWSREITVYVVEGTEEDILNKCVSIDYEDNGLIAHGKKELASLLVSLMRIEREPFDAYWTPRYGYVPTSEQLHEERKWMLREISNLTDPLVSAEYERRLKDICKDIKMKDMVDAYLAGDSIIKIMKDFNSSAGLVYYYLRKTGVYQRRYIK
jgi:hypothetical protein